MSIQGQQAVIICGFVCIGKTYLAENWLYHNVYDMETIRNNEGLDYKRYIARISALASEHNAIILVGTERNARRRLQSEGLTYVRVSPDPRLKEEWLRRQWRRDGEGAAIFLRQRWDTWVEDARRDFSGELSRKRFELGYGEFLEAKVPEIIRWFEDNVFFYSW